MKATQLLNNPGQSIWLDNITRDPLDTGELKNYIDTFWVTGPTANPTIFETPSRTVPRTMPRFAQESRKENPAMNSSARRAGLRATACRWHPLTGGSMPVREIFENQTRKYRDSVLRRDASVRLALEQASTFGWERYAEASGCINGMETFEASAPLRALQKKVDFEPDHVVSIAKELRGRR